jgi:ATP-dependent DNA helicase PIF1
MQEPDPVLDPTSADYLQDEAIKETDWQLLQNFHIAIKSEIMETCNRCNERWFNMDLKDNVCGKCRRVDAKKEDDEPYLYRTLNNADPGDVSHSLPKLSGVEEMLIARVHVFMQAWLKRGVQYKYKGHVVHFLCNTGMIYHKLPLLPSELNITIIRPNNTATVPWINQQSNKDTRVWRSHVRVWLQYLRRHHYGYRNIEISNYRLNELPVDDDVEDQLIVQDQAGANTEAEEQARSNEEGDGHDDEPAVAAVKDLIADTTEIEQLREQIRQKPQNNQNTVGNQPDKFDIPTAPAVRSTPLNQFDESEPQLSMAFPTLFPQGLAEYTTPCPRAITFSNFVRHLFLQKSGRFYQHPCFRYAVFNMITHHQINDKAGFFMRKKRLQDKDITIEDLRRAFEEDTPDSAAMLNSITRYAGSLRGTPSYWNGHRHGVSAFVRQAPKVVLFITHSAADYHWHPLLQFMDSYVDQMSPAERATSYTYEKYVNGTRSERIRYTREFLRDNPAIAAYHFHCRLEAFRKHVLMPKLCITDYWTRYEWQARGNSHNPGLYWVDSALVLSASTRQEFLDLWGIHVTAMNLQPSMNELEIEDRMPMSYVSQ